MDVKSTGVYSQSNNNVISRLYMNANNASDTLKEVSYVTYPDTGYFSGIVLDYLDKKPGLRPFYQYEPDLEGLKKAINDRKDHSYNRRALVEALQQQYTGIDISEAVARNLGLLADENTFTITTAHQPNIFTGPLYFIYKIIHAIKLAETLSRELPSNNFVPVFFMGSEDADLEELGHFVVDGKKYIWTTKQTGAVGRMKVDKPFLSLINELKGQLGVLPQGEEMLSIFRESYVEGKTIQECSLRLVNALFGNYGLIVLIPDTPALKQMFQPVIVKELQEQFSHKAVEQTIAELSKQYKVQAGGRELNLFYLLNDKRERIEFSGTTFKIKPLGLEFTMDEILIEVNNHPERFSPNVILRGVFQETILPNVAFIGGGGEIAYWLELKKVFEAVNTPYPVLVLRNSFLLMNTSQQEMLSGLGFTIREFFRKPEALLNELTRRSTAHQLSLSEETGELNLFYQQLHEVSSAIDPSLGDHVNALQAKALKRIIELEKKMLRAEKHKFEAEKRKINKLKELVFPNGSLQERVENVSGFYARHGSNLIRKIYQHSPALEQQFTVITL